MSNPFKESYSEPVDRYLTGLIPLRDVVLAKMEAYAIELGFPFVGPLVGSFLAQMARSIQAKRVFELGSGFGYSAVHFARALPADGKVICTDGDPHNAKLAADYFAEAGLSDKIDFRVGDAVTTLNECEGPFDIILMDIDKQDYPYGFKSAWPKLRVGGLFITDNMLWHGLVMIGDEQPSTLGIVELSKLLYSTPNALTTILPLRDGVAVTLKTG